MSQSKKVRKFKTNDSIKTAELRTLLSEITNSILSMETKIQTETQSLETSLKKIRVISNNYKIPIVGFIESLLVLQIACNMTILDQIKSFKDQIENVNV